MGVAKGVAPMRVGAAKKSSREPCKDGDGFQLVSRTGRPPLHPGTARTSGQDHQGSIQELQNRYKTLGSNDGTARIVPKMAP